MSSFALLLGRICISVIFLLSGFQKFGSFDATVKYMTAAGLPYASSLLVIAAIVEIVGGFSLLLGWKARFGAIVLLLYLIPVTYVFHNFWEVTDAAHKQLEAIMFLKNLAIFGGLIYVAAIGPGGCSIDYCRCPKLNK
jgi:putative oxidoreductase